MRCNADRLIQGLIKAHMKELAAIDEAKEKSRQDWDRSKTTVVTISRGFGAMGKEIGHLLADVLELRCCDSHILQEVARRANVDESLVRVLDEHINIVNADIDNRDEPWWKTLVSKYSFTHEDYYEFLAKTVLSISLHGGVIIGRGANFILGPERAFRVRLIGSPIKCAERVAEREGIGFEQALQKVRDTDRERTEFLQKIYHADINDPQSYDMVLNTDRFNRIQTVELILEALQRAGYKLPSDAIESIAVHAG